MYKIFTLITAIVCGATAIAQTSLKGTIKDEKGLPIEYVAVSVLAATDSIMVRGELTDKQGNYEVLLLKGGAYLLRATMVGYTTVYSKVITIADGTVVTADNMTMKQSSAELKGVAIVSKKPVIEVQADKIVFNVESSINATGSNAMELLQKSPGVMVDNNDNISMKGKTGVRIYIDGKMSQLDTKDLAAYLKSINSNDVEAIEMISNPSAKYDASGNAGIVNIRLKKNKKYGTNGSVSLGLVQGISPKGNGSLALNYRDKKVNLFSNIGVSVGDNHNGMNIYRKQRDSIFDQHSANINSNNNLNLKGGADFFINRKSTFGVLATGSFSDADWTSKSNTDIYDSAHIFVKKLLANNSVPGKRTNANFNLNYAYTDTNGTEVNVDADYGLFRGEGRSTQPNNYYSAANNLLSTIVNKNYTPTDIDIYTIKAGVEQRLGKGKLSYGGKSTYVKTANTFDFFTVVGGTDVKQLDRSNGFVYTENVNALFANYQRPLTSKLNLQAGLRMENTHSNGKLTRADGIVQGDNTVDRNYTDLFPSAALTWTVNKNNSLNLTYSRRIDRPTYQDLNPFENKLDELSYEKGNAFLRPQYTSNVELTHTFMGYFNTTLGYSKVTDYATMVTDTLGNANFIQTRNVGTQQILNVSVGAPIPIAKWWMGYVNVWYSYQMFEGKIGSTPFDINIPLYGGYMQHTITLSKKYSAEVSGWYNGPAIWGGTWRSKPQGAVDIGAQMKVLHDNGTLKISATDLFYTAPWRSTNNFAGVNISANGYWESQTVRLSFTYRFGSNQITSARKREAGSESESSRIKGK